jgi:hypothetical protein
VSIGRSLRSGRNLSVDGGCRLLFFWQGNYRHFPTAEWLSGRTTNARQQICVPLKWSYAYPDWCMWIFLFETISGEIRALKKASLSKASGRRRLHEPTARRGEFYSGSSSRSIDSYGIGVLPFSPREAIAFLFCVTGRNFEAASKCYCPPDQCSTRMRVEPLHPQQQTSP